MVNDAVERDVAQGVLEAKFVQNKVTRKVVKQTVMTDVYGVTFIGGREQIAARLKGAHPRHACRTVAHAYRPR